MAFANPSDSAEILYGASGDVRDEINSFVLTTTAGHYADESEIPGSLIIKSLVKATRLINSFLEPVYADSVPFGTTASVPKLLDEFGNDIAVYYVFRSATAKLGRLPDDKKDQYFDQYVSTDPSNPGFLTRIADKKIQLPELTAVSPAEAKSVRTKGRYPIFDVDDIKNQEVDPDLLDDINNDKQ